MTCRATKVSGIPTSSAASNFAIMVTEPFPSAAMSMKAIVLAEFKPEIELRSGKSVMAINNVTSRIWINVMEEFKKMGENKRTTAGAIAGATELTDAVLFATIEKRMYATSPLERAATTCR